MMPQECPSCGQEHIPVYWLCRGCWFRLPASARGRIYLDKEGLPQRRKELLIQLERGVALELVVIN
jgi:hypothetical protein